jgi:hypothetical protein
LLTQGRKDRKVRQISLAVLASLRENREVLKLFALRLTSHDTRLKLVMLGLDGIMETVIPPTDPEQYLSDSRFQYWGTIEDLVL